MSYQVPSSSANSRSPRLYIILSILLVLAFIIAFGGYKIVFNSSTAAATAQVTVTADASNKPVEEKKAPVLASPEEYDRKIQHITNGDSSGKWPVKTGYP